MLHFAYHNSIMPETHIDNSSSLLVQMILNPCLKLHCLPRPNNVLLEYSVRPGVDEYQPIHQAMQLFSLCVSPCDSMESYRSFGMSQLKLPKIAANSDENINYLSSIVQYHKLASL